MSGHNKWSTIKNKKGAADMRKGKIFSDVSKQIRLAVKEGKSGDPKFNSSLRLALEKAHEANMPKENVQRAIDRGLGKGKSGALQEVVYEGYGPGGAGLLVVAHTDNHQRTAGEIRFIFSRCNAAMGGPGSAMYLFTREGDDFKVNIPTEISDPNIQGQIQSLIDALRENSDVEDVYCAGVWEEKE